MYTPPDRLLDADFWSCATRAEVEAELARGIDPNITEADARIPDTVTPLHLAAGYAKSALIAVLLDAGADIEAREDYLDRTPIHMAAAFNADAGAVALLVERGADMWARDKYGETILHVAAGHGQRAVVELLLDLGMAIDAVDDWDNTPLHKAAWNRGTETAELLVARGADRAARTKHGHTPHQLGLEATGKRLYGMERDGAMPEQIALQRQMDEELLRVLES